MKICLVYVFLVGITWVAVLRHNSILTLDSMLIIAILIPTVILLGIPLQWFLDIKPITDRIYKQEKMKRKYPFFHHRFTKVD